MSPRSLAEDGPNLIMIHNLNKTEKSQKSYYNEIVGIFDSYKSTDYCFKYREFVFNMNIKLRTYRSRDKKYE